MKLSLLFICPTLYHLALLFQLAESIPCDLPACVNGKAIKSNNESSECVCDCDPGFSGKYCDDKDVCDSHSSCYHGGRCLQGASGEPHCECQDGYSPPNCRERDPCAQDNATCFNGGTCRRVHDTKYTCACPLPFRGKNCQTKDLCTLNTGECLDTLLPNGTVVTECYPCSINVQPTNSCLQVLPGQYMCRCINGFDGNTCNDIVTETNMYNITIPIYSLRFSQPQTFIVFRISLPLMAVNTLMAIKSPPNYKFHIAIRDTYRPVCTTIIDQWNRVLPDDDRRLHFFMPPFGQDTNPTQNRSKRWVGGTLTKKQKREQYAVIWPEYMHIPISAPLEVTLSLGVYTVDCISEEQVLSDPSFNSYEVIQDCAIQSKDRKTKIHFCHCLQETPFKSLIPSLRKVEIELESYQSAPPVTEIGYCYLVLWIVVGVLIFYILLVVVLFIFDIRSWRRTKLIVNVHIDRILEETFYLVTVVTGSYPGSSTTANLYLELRGSCFKSNPIPICDHILKGTCRYNSEDNYLVSTTKHLGELLGIRMWHDSTGPAPDWYCKRVIVQEIRSQKRWYFIVNDSMSLDMGTLLLSTPVATKKQVEALHRVTFSEALFHELAEQHILCSFFALGSYTDYPHSARVTVFFFVAFLRMFFILYLYGLPDELETDYLFDWEEPYPLGHDVIFFAVFATLFGIPFRALFRCFFTYLKVKRVPTLIVCTAEPRLPPSQLPPPQNKSAQLHHTEPIIIPKDNLSSFQSSTASFLPPIALTESLPKLRSSSEEFQSFQIPSTSVSETENWIAQNIQTPLNPTETKLIRSFSVRPSPPFSNRVISHGIMGAVVSMKDKGRTQMVYPAEGKDLKTLIADDIRSSYKHKDAPGSQLDKPDPLSTDSLLLDASPVESESSRLSDTPSSEAEIVSEGPHSIFAPPSTTPSTKKFKGMYVELCETKHAGVREWHRPCRIIIWIILLLGIATLATLTGFYGIRYGTTKCINWSYSAIWTIFFSQFVASCITVILVSILIILIARCRNLSYENKLQKCRFNIIWLNATCILPKRWPLNYIRYIYKTVPGPKSCYGMFTMRMIAQKESRLQRYAVDAFVFFIYAICLILISSCLQSQWYYSFRNSASETLLAHRSQAGIPGTLFSIHRRTDFYTYMRDSFIKSIQKTSFISKVRFTKADSQKGVAWLQHGVSFIIGSIRLRQHRVRPETCRLKEWKKTFSPLQKYACNAPFDESAMETRLFQGNWSLLYQEPLSGPGQNYPDETAAVSETGPGLRSDWIFSHPSETGSYTATADYATYNGGGYVVDMFLDMQRNQELINSMEAMDWIDERTRAIIIEFALYDPFVRTCISTQIVLERSAFHTWNPVVISESSNIRLIHEITHSQWYILVCIVIIALCLPYFTFRFILNIRSAYALYGKRALINLWLWLDLLIIILGVSLFVTFYLWDREGYRIEQEIALADEQHISFQHVLLLRYIFVYNIVAALLTTYIKCWRLLVPSYKKWYVISLTFSLTWRLVLGFLLSYALLLVSFAAFRTLFMGKHHDHSKNFHESFLSMIQLAKIFSYVKYNQLKRVNTFLAPLCYALYVFLAYWISINIIISVFTAGLQDAAEAAAQKSYKHTYITYVYIKFRNSIPKWMLPKQKSKTVDKDVSVTGERFNEMKVHLLVFLRANQKGWLPKQMFRMRAFSQNQIARHHPHQKIVSRERKYVERLAQLAKIPPDKLNSMKQHTIHLIKQQTGRDYSLEQFDSYSQFNRSLLIIKCNRMLEALENISNGLMILEAQARRRRYKNL